MRLSNAEANDQSLIEEDVSERRAYLKELFKHLEIEDCIIKKRDILLFFGIILKTYKPWDHDIDLKEGQDYQNQLGIDYLQVFDYFEKGFNYTFYFPSQNQKQVIQSYLDYQVKNKVFGDNVKKKLVKGSKRINLIKSHFKQDQ